VLFQGHSGSTAFVDMLGGKGVGHPEVRTAAHEPISDMRNKHARGSVAQLNYTTSLFLRAARDNVRGRARRLQGFKMRVGPILKNPAAWRALVHGFGTRIIWQEDPNYLRDILRVAMNARLLCAMCRSSKPNHALFSHKRGTTCRDCGRFKTAILHFMQQGKFFTEADVEAVLPVHLPLDYQYLNGQMRKRVDVHRTMARAVSMLDPPGGVLHVTYQELLDSPRETIERSLAHLGVATPCLSRGGASRYRRPSTKPLCRMISNWEDVCMGYAGCSSHDLQLLEADGDCTCGAASRGCLSQWNASYVGVVHAGLGAAASRHPRGTPPLQAANNGSRLPWTKRLARRWSSWLV
jgi:hypothetical protein